MTRVTMWQGARALHWILWIAFFAFCIYVRVNRASILTILQQLPQSVELTMYGLAVAAVFAGFLEMMMRERAGLARARFGRMTPVRMNDAQPTPLRSR